SHDADGNPLTTAYQWTRNGTDISGATGSTLNLASAGNGDRGDLIRVRVTVNDGTAPSAPLTAGPVTVANTAPVATVGLAPANPGTAATVTATATKSDADGDAVGLTYVWRVNGTIVRTFSSASALTDTLDLSVAGNGDPGDTVRVDVTPNDGTADGTAVNAQVTVAAPNTPPVVDTVVISPSNPTTGQTLTATVTSHDADGNPLTTAYQWTRNGTDISGATGSTLNLASAGNGDKGDLIRVRVTVNDGTATSAPVTSSPVTVANTAPVATVGLAPASPGTAATVTATATKTDADGDAVGLTFVWRVNGSVVRTFSSASALTDTLDLSVAGNGDPGDTVRVDVTPNDGSVDGAPVNAQVTVAAAGPTVYASDTFTRTVNNNWGSATTGGAYTLTGSAGDYDVIGTTGTIAVAAGSNRSASLAGVSAQDVELSFRFTTDKVPTGGSHYVYGIARRVNATNAYRIKLRIAPNGAVFVHATALVNNVETSIGSEVAVAGLTSTPGSFIRVRAQLSGSNPTTIRVRAWAATATEPTTWQYTQTNTAAALQVAGGVGLQTYLSSGVTNAPVLVTFDDLLVTSIP
ncbi:MAG TPA: hypothetical protein VK891_07020, partial [Euzebyales bacterium]|nr:hypothetical protein [Euzebyales bacterium]